MRSLVGHLQVHSHKKLATCWATHASCRRALIAARVLKVSIVYRRWVPAPQSDADAGLGPDVAVGSRIQGLAATVGRGHASRHKHDGGGPVHGQVHARGHARAAAAWLHGLAHKMHSHQRRGAGCVDGHAWALQQHDETEETLLLSAAAHQPHPMQNSSESVVTWAPSGCRCRTGARQPRLELGLCPEKRERWHSWQTPVLRQDAQYRLPLPSAWRSRLSATAPMRSGRNNGLHLLICGTAEDTTQVNTLRAHLEQ